MTATPGFCFGLMEASAMLQQPWEFYRHALDLNRRMLDLNQQHALDFNDSGLPHAHHHHRAPLLFDACAFDSRYQYAPMFAEFWHQQQRDFWSRGLPNWQELLQHFTKQERDLTARAQARVVAVPEKRDGGRFRCNGTLSAPQNPAAKYIIASPAWLPDGWITEVQTRRTGTTAGTKDKYYKDPVSGRRFRSRNEVFRFLETGKGRVRKRYKRRIALSESTTTQTACVVNQFLSTFAGNPYVFDAGSCQPPPIPACPLASQPRPVAKDISLQPAYVAFTHPPLPEKLPEECQQPSKVSRSAAPDPFNKGLEARAKTAEQVCTKVKPQRSPAKKKVRFEAPRKGVERQDSRLWQWLQQKPVGQQGSTIEQEQRLEVKGAKTEKGRAEEGRPLDSNKQAGLKKGPLPARRKRARPREDADDDEWLSILRERPGLTSRQRAKLKQKMKTLRAKQLLAILGRKICCQWLGLAA